MIKMDDKPPAIGIDLGTTYSCVAVYQYVKVEIIANDQGDRTTPSCVAFTDKERLIGNAAKDQIAENHQNTVYNVKRLIGRMYNEEAVQQDRNHLSFKVIDKAGKPNVSVSYKNEARTFTPEQISAMILGKMKEIAESFLGCKVKDAVITVPAYFNDAQRRATKDAGIIAGLNVLRIINEPTAAALAYGLDQKTQGEQNVLIFDLGGGTFDVSILTIDDGVFNAIATSGNTHLGGEDFDIRIVKYFVKIILEKYEKDIRDDKRALRRLQTACEQAKRMLSSLTQTFVYVESLFDGIDFKHNLTRAKFEDLCCDLFDSTLDQVTKALKDANMEKSDIDEVILVGGSTRIPYIQTRLREYFNGIELNTKIDPDEAVAYGAAVQAAILNGDMSKEIQDILLLDISPLSLGLQTEGGLMTHFIKRNCSIPTSVTKLFSTTRDNQTSVLLQIFEGERHLVKDNYLLGSFQLNGIPPAPRKVPLIEVTFEIDANGILNVSAMERNSGNKDKITITNDRKSLTKDQIDKMIIEAEKFRKEDETQREKILAQNMLREYAYQLKSTILQDGFRAKMLIEEQKRIENKVGEILKWLKANGNAFKSDYESKLKELNTICLPILAKYKEKSSKIISNGASHSRNGTFLQNHLTNGKHENNHDKSRSGPTIEELN